MPSQNLPMWIGVICLNKVLLLCITLYLYIRYFLQIFTHYPIWNCINILLSISWGLQLYIHVLLQSFWQKRQFVCLLNTFYRNSSKQCSSCKATLTSKSNILKKRKTDFLSNFYIWQVLSCWSKFLWCQLLKRIIVPTSDICSTLLSNFVPAGRGYDWWY